MFCTGNYKILVRENYPISADLLRQNLLETKQSKAPLPLEIVPQEIHIP